MIQTILTAIILLLCLLWTAKRLLKQQRGKTSRCGECTECPLAGRCSPPENPSV